MIAAQTGLDWPGLDVKLNLIHSTFRVRDAGQRWPEEGRAV